MRTTQHNGEHWYHDIRPLWLRVLRWLVWLGGWDEVVWTPQGVTSRLRPRHAIRLALGARGNTTRALAFLDSMTPVALCGHRVVIQRYGLRARLRRTYLCISWPTWSDQRWRIYLSSDSTPASATWWLCGAPAAIVRAADLTCLSKSADQAGRAAREAAHRYAARAAVRVARTPKEPPCA